MIAMFAFILKVKESNFENRVLLVNSGKLTKYFPM
jgi:hypothetical protein